MFYSIVNLRSEIFKLLVRLLQLRSIIEASGCAWTGRILLFKYVFVNLWWHLGILRLSRRFPRTKDRTLLCYRFLPFLLSHMTILLIALISPPRYHFWSYKLRFWINSFRCLICQFLHLIRLGNAPIRHLAHALAHIADVVRANSATLFGFLRAHPKDLRGHGFASSSRTLWDLWEFATSLSKPPERPLSMHLQISRPFFNTFV